MHQGDREQVQAVWERLQARAQQLGFSQIGVADVDLSDAEPGLLAWLRAGFAGTMHYMAAHGLKRMRPSELIPGTVRVITARMDYLPRADPLVASSVPPATVPSTTAPGAAHEPPESDWRHTEWQRLKQAEQAVVSVYARGRDYHKVLRSRLQQLADHLAAQVGPLGHRVFVDSAPVAEVELAQRSGIGWRGKHTLLLHPQAGSMFFLGEIYVDLPLPVTAPQPGHCGTCTHCITACPTQAIVAPYRLDARRCISYLTIEHDGDIPVDLRPAMGNRIYGCDDCQLACPWNKFARRSALPDFDERHGLASATLLELWNWSESEFLRRTEGSAIRRIGHLRWRRNLAVAIGNALRSRPLEPSTQALVEALERDLPDAPSLLREHMVWALEQTS